MIQGDIIKYMKGNERVAQAHFAQTNFTGMTSIPTLNCNRKSPKFSSKKGLWIIDTGASNHICKDLHLLTDVNSLTSPIPVFLLDGKTYLVQQVGRVPLTQGLCLNNVLYLPSFRFNLISVHHLCLSTNLRFHFSCTSYQLQDRKTAEVMVVGKVHGTYGYLGLRPSTTGQSAQPKSPKGIRPRSQPAHERPANPLLGCPGISYLGCLLTQVLTFPIDNSTKQTCQPALHITSVSSPMN